MAKISEFVCGTLALLTSERVPREHRFALLQVLEKILPSLTAAEVKQIKDTEIYRSNKTAIFEQAAAYWHWTECNFVEKMVSRGVNIDRTAMFEAHIPLSAYQHEIDFFLKQQVTSILHVGSGAFPASAFVLESFLPSARITCVERCDRSFQLSSKLVSCLGSGVSIIHSDIADVSNFETYDCILFSLNVLNQKELVALCERSISRPTLMVTRSASGWASLLYPETKDTETQVLDVPERQEQQTRAALSFRWVLPQ